jgi:hypothetical protein
MASDAKNRDQPINLYRHLLLAMIAIVAQLTSGPQHFVLVQLASA